MLLSFNFPLDRREDCNTSYHKNYNFLDCDWFKKLLFSTNSLAKLLSAVCYRQFVIGQFNEPITFKVVV